MRNLAEQNRLLPPTKVWNGTKEYRPTLLSSYQCKGKEGRLNSQLEYLEGIYLLLLMKLTGTATSTAS